LVTNTAFTREETFAPGAASNIGRRCAADRGALILRRVDLGRACRRVPVGEIDLDVERRRGEAVTI